MKKLLFTKKVLYNLIKIFEEFTKSQTLLYIGFYLEHSGGGEPCNKLVTDLS